MNGLVQRRSHYAKVPSEVDECLRGVGVCEDFGLAVYTTLNAQRETRNLDPSFSLLHYFSAYS